MDVLWTSGMRLEGLRMNHIRIQEAWLAERVGFEPTVRFRTHDFQSCTFGLSVISPGQKGWNTNRKNNNDSEVPAERAGFEPAVPLRAHLISNQAPSASRSSLRGGPWQKG